jgi:hypothetical protein
MADWALPKKTHMDIPHISPFSWCFVPPTSLHFHLSLSASNISPRFQIKNSKNQLKPFTLPESSLQI